MTLKTNRIRHLYRSEFSCFVELAFRALHPNVEYLDHWLNQVLCRALERCFHGDTKRLIINLPPRYLKSFTASIAFPAWVLARRPEAKILCVSGTTGLAITQHLEAKELMTHPRYKAIYPHVRVQEKGRSLRLVGGGSRSGFTATGGITGRGADFTILDDPLPPNSTNDENRRESLNGWFDQNVEQRLDRKSSGVIIVVMQRLHIDDLTAHLMRHEGWELLSFPAIAEKEEKYSPLFGDRILREKGEALNPGLATREQLRETMLSVGAINFMSQYQQKPYPPGKGDFRAGCWSSLREGVEWTPDQPDPILAFMRRPEEDILLHTVFGEGDHPWPDDMRTKMTILEWVKFNEKVMKWQRDMGFEQEDLPT